MNAAASKCESFSPLFYLVRGARIFKLLLDGRGFVFANAFFDRLGSAINQVLGFLKTQAGNFTNGLDDVDLVAAHVGERYGEFALLSRRSRTSSRSSSRSYRSRSRGRHTEGFFHFLHQVGRFKKRQALDFFQD